MRISKKLSALGAFFVIAAVVAGCGSSIPGNSVASVAGNPITLQAYNHWMYVAAKEEAASQPGEPVIVPSSPPDFTSCIAQIRAAVPTLAGTSDADLKTDCKQVFTEFNNEVMSFLIEGYWYQADAAKMGINYTSADLASDYAKARKSQFPTQAEFNAYLKESGETEQDVQFQVRVSEIYRKLLARATKKVDAASIASYYNAHKSEFGSQETRNVHLIRTTSAAKAQAAYNALKSGQSWEAVAKQYAADAASKANAGLLTGVTNGEEEKAASNAIFGGALNKLVGPVKGLFGYYVLEVVKIVPATQRTLAQESATIKTLLNQQQETAAEAVVTKQSKANWGSKTLCRVTYSITDCVGYKAPVTTTTPATTAPATGTATGTATGGSTATLTSTTTTPTTTTKTSTTG
jgi:parvulin-like peptidyl-prolyl isomerase